MSAKRKADAWPKGAGEDPKRRGDPQKGAGRSRRGDKPMLLRRDRLERNAFSLLRSGMIFQGALERERCPKNITASKAFQDSTTQPATWATDGFSHPGQGLHHLVDSTLNLFVDINTGID